MVHRWPIGAVLLVLTLGSCSPPPPLKVGFLAGLSGSVSQLGIESRRSLEMAVAGFNRNGGVKGRAVELMVQDDGNEVSQAQEAYRRFDEAQVVAVIGPLASTVVDSLLPILNERRILTVSPTVSATSVSGLDDWFFRVITVNRTMGEVLGAYALERGLDDVAVLRETSNGAYTAPILEAFQRTLEAEGRGVARTVEFDLRATPDYEALAQALGDAPCYLVLANGFDAAQVGQKLAQKGRRGPLLAPPWSMTSDLIALGGRQVERMVFVSVYDSQSTSPAWLHFREEYRSLYGDEPGFAALYTHDAWTVLTKALEQAASFSPEDLRAAVLALGSVDGLQSSFRLDATGDVVRDLFLLTVREGRFVRIDP